MSEVKHEKCRRCNVWRIPSLFLNDKGRKLKTCKKCRVIATRYRKKHEEKNKKKKKEYDQKYYQNNKEKIALQSKQFQEDNKEILKIKSKKYREENKEKIALKSKKYRERNKEKIALQKKKYRIENKEKVAELVKINRERNKCEHGKDKHRCQICDPQGYLINIIRSRSYKALKCADIKKNKTTMEYICCTIEEFKTHIQNKFKEGMTWENQGEWHIDHIIPLCYNNPTMEQTIERLHWTNTQPLWASENIAKGHRYIE